MPPVAQGGRYGWTSPSIRREIAGLPVGINHLRVGTAVPKPNDAGGGVIEREDIWGRPVRTLVGGVDGHPRAGPCSPALPQAGLLRATWRQRHRHGCRHPAAAGRAGPAPRRRTCLDSKR